MNKQVASVLIAACALSTGVCAQEVYRCGDSYSTKPCANATVVDVQDARTSEQQAQAAASAKEEAQLAKTLERDRLKREAQDRAALRKSNAQHQPKVKVAKTTKAVKTVKTVNTVKTVKTTKSPHTHRTTKHAKHAK